MSTNKPKSVTFDEDEALTLAERTFSTEIDEQLASDIIQYANRLHSRYQQPTPDVVTQILSLISDECRYWQGRDEALRGGYAILHAKAKELVSKQPASDVTVLVTALEEIIAPIQFMQERLEEGEQLNGMLAVQLTKDPEYLKDIAKDALANYRKQMGDL